MKAEMEDGAAVAASAVVLPVEGIAPRNGVGGLDAVIELVEDERLKR